MSAKADAEPVRACVPRTHAPRALRASVGRRTEEIAKHVEVV